MVKEYCAGDRVVIKDMTGASYREDCQRMFGCDELAGLVTGMYRHMGSEAKIVRVIQPNSGTRFHRYEINKDHQLFWWDAAMFEDGEIVFDVDMNGAEVLI